MRRCDWNHGAREVRLLPTGGDGNIQCCKTHYRREMIARMTSHADEIMIQWKDLTSVEDD